MAADLMKCHLLGSGVMIQNIDLQALYLIIAWLIKKTFYGIFFHKIPYI